MKEEKSIEKVNLSELKEGDIALVEFKVTEVRNGIVDLQIAAGENVIIFRANPETCKFQIFPGKNLLPKIYQIKK